MPNIGNYEKVITYKVEADASNANKVIDALQNGATKNPIKVNVEIDEKTIKEQLGRIIGTLTSVIDKGQLKVGGINKLETALEGINEAIKNIQTTMRKKTPFQLESEISEAEGRIKTYQSKIKETYKSLYGTKPRADIKNGNIKNISGIMDQLKPHDDLLNKSAQELGADLMGNDFDRVIKKIAQVAASGQDLYKITTKVGHDEYNYIDMWHNLMSGMKGIRERLGYKSLGSFLSNAGISEETRNLINYISQVVRAQSSLKSLRQEKEYLDNASPTGVKVQIDTESINALSEALSGIKAVIGDDENIKIGFNSEDVQKITDAFSELKNILVVIKDSIVSFSVPIKTQDISKLKEEISYFKQLDDAINNYKDALGKNSPNANAAFSNITNLISTRTGKQYSDDELAPIKEYIQTSKSSGNILGFLNDSYGLQLSKSILSMTSEASNSGMALDKLQVALNGLIESIDKMSTEVTGAISGIQAVNVSFSAAKLNNEQIKSIKISTLSDMDNAVGNILKVLNEQEVANSNFKRYRDPIATVGSILGDKTDLFELPNLLGGEGTLDQRITGLKDFIPRLMMEAQKSGYNTDLAKPYLDAFNNSVFAMQKSLGIGEKAQDPLSQSLSSAFANALQENTSFSELATSISSFTEQLSGLITGLSTVNTTLDNLATEIATQNKTIAAGDKPIKLNADSAVISSAVLSEAKDNQAAIAAQKEVATVTKISDTTGIDEQNEKLALDTELAKKDIIVKKEVMKVTSTADTSGVEKQNEVVQESIDLSKKDTQAKKELVNIEDDVLKPQMSNASLVEKGTKAKDDALNASTNADISGIEKQNEALQKDIKLAKKDAKAKKEAMNATANADIAGIEKQNEALKESVDLAEQSDNALTEQNKKEVKDSSYYLSQKGIVDEGAWSTTESIGFAQTLKKHFFYDDQGDLQATESLSTNFDKLSKLIFQNDKAIIKLEDHIKKLNAEGIDTTAAEENLKYLKDAEKVMNAEMDTYFGNPDYAPNYSTEMKMQFNRKRLELKSAEQNRINQENVTSATNEQNKTAIANYKAEQKDAAKYYELRIKEQQKVVSLSQDEVSLLQEMEQRRQRAFNMSGEFSGSNNDVLDAAFNFATHDQDVAKSRIHADLTSKETHVQTLLNNDDLNDAYKSRLEHILSLITKINANPLDLTNAQTIKDLALINDEFEEIKQTQRISSNKDTIANYKALQKESKKYWKLRIKEHREGGISEQERLDLDALETKRSAAFRGLNEYAGTNTAAVNARNIFKQNDTVGITEDISKQLTAKATNVKSLQHLNGLSDEFKASLSEILTLINEINKSPLDFTDENTLKNLAQLEDKYQTMLSTKGSDASKDGTNIAIKMREDFETFLSNNTAAMANPKLRSAIKTLRKDLEGLIPSSTAEDAAKLSRKISELKTKIKSGRSGGNSFLTGFSKALKSANTQFLIRFFSFQDMIRYGRQIFSYVQQLDSALTELRVVSNATAGDLSRVSKEAYNIANELGSTTTEIVQSITSWRRLGKSIEDSMVLAEQAAKLSTGGIMDTATATEALTSAMQAFDYSASDVSDVVDQFIYLGNNYAITSEELATSLENSSAALVAAGNSLEEAEAIVVAGNTVMQDANSVSNAAKVISMRLRGTTAKELEGAGEDTEGLIENASKLYSTIKNLTKVAGKDGVSIIDPQTKEYKSTYQILLEIAQVWDKLSDVNQAALLETIAGKVRGAAAAAILQNPDVLESAFNSASNDAEGAGTKALEASMDSIEKRIAVIKNEWQGIWQQTIESKTVKGILKFVEKLLGVIGKLIKTVGPVGVIGAAIGGSIGLKDIDKLPVLLGKLPKVAASLSESFQLFRMDGVNPLSAGVGALGVEFGAAVPAILGVAGAIAALVAIYKVWDHFNTTHQEALEIFEDASSKAEQYRSEVESLNNELTDTKNRIDELNALDSLTLVEQAELEHLEQTNDELERQLEIRERLSAAANLEAAKAAEEAAFKNQYADGFWEQIGLSVAASYGQVFNPTNNTITDVRTGEVTDYNSNDLTKLSDATKQIEENNAKINELREKQSEASNYNVDDLKTQVEALKEQNKELGDEYDDILLTPYSEGQDAERLKEIRAELKKNKELIQEYQDEITIGSVDYEAEIAALENANSKLETEASEVADRLEQYEEAWRKTGDPKYLKMAEDTAKELREYSQIGMTSTEKSIDNIEDLISNRNIKTYLEDAEKSGKTAAQAARELGINLKDLNIPETDLNKYFSDLTESISDANINLIEFTGTVGEVESAFESANASAQWDKMSEHAAAVKELYEAGKTGTDDFQSFVEFISPESFSIPENINATEFDSQAYQKEYERLKKKIERYFTPDDTSTDNVNEATTSMNNLLSDLTKNGMAEYANGVYHWTDAFQTTSDAAKALGIDVKATEVLLHSLEDYGFEFQDVLWSGEAASNYESKVGQIKEAAQALKDSGGDEGFLAMIDRMEEEWNAAIQTFQTDLSALTEDQTIHLDFVYDLTQLQQDITTAKENAELYGGQDINANAGVISSQNAYIKEAMNKLGMDQEGVELPPEIKHALAYASYAKKQVGWTDINDTQAMAKAQGEWENANNKLIDILTGYAEQGWTINPDIEIDPKEITKKLKAAQDAIDKKPLLAKLGIEPDASIEYNDLYQATNYSDINDVISPALQAAPQDATISFRADVEGVEQEVYSILDAEGNIVYFANVDGVLTALDPLREEDGTLTYHANTNPAATAVNAMQRYADGLTANLSIGADITKFNQAMNDVQSRVAALGTNASAAGITDYLRSSYNAAYRNYIAKPTYDGVQFNGNGNGGSGISDRSSGKGSGGGGGGGGGDSKSPAEELKDKFDDLYDWIEVWIKRVNESIEKWETQAELYTSTMSNKKSLASQLKRFNEAQRLAEKSATRSKDSAAAYLKTANSVGLKDSYKKLVQNGDWDKIEKIANDGLLRAQIDLYTEWYEKYLNAKNQQFQWEQKLVELEQNKLDAIQSHYEALRANYETTIANIESVISRREAAGFSAKKSQYTKIIDNEEAIVKNLTKERDKLLKELKNGGLKKGSDEYNKKLAEIRAINQDINEHSANIYEATKSIHQLTIESNETNKNIKQAIVDRLDAVATLTETHGNRVNDQIYQKEINKIMSENGNILNINNDLFEQIKDNFSEDGMWAKEAGKKLNEKQIKKVNEYILNGDLGGLKNYLEKRGFSFNQMTGLKDIMSQIYENQEEYLSNANSIEERVDKLQESRTKAIQDMIDGIEDIHEAAEKALELQKAQYEYEKALNNKTVRTWNGNEWVYTADVAAIQSAQEALDDLNYQALIDGLNKAIEDLEKLATDTNIYEDDGTLRENWKQIIDDYKDGMNDILKTWKKNVKNAGFSVEISTLSDAKNISTKVNAVNATKFATGGVISSKGKDDDTLILVSDKERVLTARQNAAFEKMVEASLNPAKNLMIAPPTIDAIREHSSSIFQTFNVSLPNINDSSTAMQLMKELQNLSTKKIQYFNQ